MGGRKIVEVIDAGREPGRDDMVKTLKKRDGEVKKEIKKRKGNRGG